MMISRWISFSLIATLLAVFLVVGCGGGATASNGESVDRAAVAAAFKASGEPLVIGLDMAVSDPESSVDVIFVPQSDDVPEPPFQVVVFKTTADAENQEQSLDAGSHAGTEIHRAKNVLVTMSSSIDDERKQHVEDALEML